MTEPTARIESVWKQTTPALEDEIIAFWLHERALPDAATARTRVTQAVCVARNPEGRLFAVCTAQPRLLPRLRQRLYYYRTFVGAEQRNSKLVYPMMLEARRVLQAHARAQDPPECIGMLIEFENRGLGQHYRQAFDEASKFCFIGYSPRGLDQRVSYFDGALLQAPSARPR